MSCRHCKDTGKYKKPDNEKQFERIIEVEMEKAYFINYDVAEEKAYKKVGYTIVECPYCKSK